MQCPYCVSQIDDAALACPHCTRDLYLFKPLLEKIETLEAQLKAQPSADIDTLQARITELEAAAAAAVPEEVSATRWLQRVLGLWLLPLLLLLLAHWLLTVVYDVNTLYLRIASILIPLPFGLWLMRDSRQRFIPWFVAAFVMAVLAVLGMSSIIAMVDGTPVLPANLLEWREFLEYAASICFSYATGMILGWSRRPHALPGSTTEKLVRFFVHGQHKAEKLQALIKRLQDVGGTATAIGTTAISAYTGLKDFIGG